MFRSTATTVPFTMPGGEVSATVRNRPVDLVHLARQTMGDRDLEQEVLNLFVQQALNVRERLAKADCSECARLAHGLRGAANGIGAFAIADCAGDIEREPSNRAAVRRLSRLIDEARDFVCAIGR
jgi:HPt (histidine-containing phosphotransfer) domain-containing protein